MSLATLYRAERAPFANAFHVWQAPARQALREARTKAAWLAAGGWTAHEFDDGNAEAPEGPGQRVRLYIRVDHDPSGAFEGDFPERELKALYERGNREGVYGVVSQFWDGAEWQDVDSCWGFIGDDWRGSGYDTDAMRAALDALADHDAAEARAAERARPDLYPEV